MVLFPESCFFVFSAQKKGRKLGFQSTFQYKVIQILNAAGHRDKRQIITASTSNKRPHDDRDGPGGWRRGGEDAATGGRRRVDPVISAMQAGAGAGQVLRALQRFYLERPPPPAPPIVLSGHAASLTPY